MVGLLALLLLLRLAFVLLSTEDDDKGPVGRGEAEQAMNELVVAASSIKNNGDGFCQQLADSIGLCRESLKQAPRRRSGQLELPVSGPKVRYRVGEKTVLATVTGTLPSGSTYESSTEFVRTSDGHVAAVDPVFWIDRGLAESVDNTAMSSP